jgi:hypothetical protein
LGCDLNRSPWLRWQLENCSFLTFSQTCQEHDLTVRKFKRIVMGRDLVFVDLTKDPVLCLISPSCHGHNLTGRRLTS